MLGRSQFAFIIGIITCKYLLIDKIKKLYNGLKYKGICLCLVFVFTFLLHCFMQSLFIAPITGMLVLMVFHLVDKPQWLKGVFLCLGKHSTNIWLIHMFFI